MTIDPLSAPRQSLAVAEARLTELRGLTEAFFAQRPYRILVAPHDEMPEHNVISFKLGKRIPWRAKKLARQSARAMRAALDQLGPCATLALGGSAIHYRNRFPFAASAGDFQQTVNRRCRDVAPQIIDLFMDCRPHPGGDEVLYALDQICRLPRRRFMVAEVSAKTVLAVEGHNHAHAVTLDAPVWNRSRREVTLLHQDPDGLFKGRIQADFYFAFGLPALRTHSVIAVLKTQLQKVGEIVAAAEGRTRGDTAWVGEHRTSAVESAAG